MLTCNSERDNKIVSFLAPVLVGRIIIIIMIITIIVGHIIVGHITTFLLINQLHVDVTPNLLLQLISDEITISIGFIITHYVEQYISSLNTRCPKELPFWKFIKLDPYDISGPVWISSWPQVVQTVLNGPQQGGPNLQWSKWS